MKVGGQILWNVTPICETSQIYYLMGRLLMKDVLENHSKDRLFLLEQWLNHRFSPRDQSRLHQFGKRLLPGIFFGCELIAGGIWCSDSRSERFGILDASEIYPRRINAKEVLLTQTGDEFIFPIGRWYSKSVREWIRIPRTHSKEGTDRKERRFEQRTSRWIGRVSTDRTNRWRWSLCRLLVDQRWLHLSSSQWTSTSTLRAEGRNMPYSTEIHWCT